MCNEVNRIRLERIHAILMEFASGNFAYRLERTDSNDEIEALTVLVNMTLEEIKDSFLHQGYVNHHATYRHLVQLLFILDEKDCIIAFNQGAKEMLLYDEEELQGKPFGSLLTSTSKTAWTHLKAKLRQESNRGQEVFSELSLTSKQHLILTTNCLVCKTAGSSKFQDKLIISSIELVKKNNGSEKKLSVGKNFEIGKNRDRLHTSLSQKQRIHLSSLDIGKIRAVHDHILNNLDRPLSQLITLAHSFGTNEYKLKYGFKQLYGTTVFRFLTNERLRKAGILIQHTDLPIKAVAQITGFKSVSHFSKVFKQKYGYPPKVFRNRGQNRM